MVSLNFYLIRHNKSKIVVKWTLVKWTTPVKIYFRIRNKKNLQKKYSVNNIEILINLIMNYIKMMMYISKKNNYN